MNSVDAIYPDMQSGRLYGKIITIRDPMKSYQNIDIKQCMDKKSMKPTKKETSMLIGVYGGKSLDDMTLELYKPSVFDSQVTFDKVLSRVYKSLRGVEKGISEMKSHGMCHGDLSSGNVVIKRGKSKLIDFGLACTDKQLSYLSKRLRFISKIDRIYEPYPYEYMCNAMNKTQLKRELKEFQYRDRFEGYTDIYETVLGDRPNSQNTRLFTTKN